MKVRLKLKLYYLYYNFDDYSIRMYFASYLFIYGTCHKKLYEIRRLSVTKICSFSASSPRVSAELSKGVRGIVRGCPQNRERVSAES